MSSVKNKMSASLFLGIIFLFFSAGLPAQDHHFEIIAKVKSTPVKDQARSGTCWSFATVSFIESELIRKGKGELDLSEMFNVRCAYPEKAVEYMRMHGNNNFAAGGQAHDVMNVIRKYGIVPDTFYPGLCCDEKKHNHNELDDLLSTIAQYFAKLNKPSLMTEKVIGAVLDEYLGQIPEKFDFNGKSYTPLSFAGYLGINPDDYVELTSFTHHTWYSLFALEIPDNWSRDLYYNVKIEEMLEVMENALKNGYSIAWDGDVSEDDFEFSSGYAEVTNAPSLITQEYRQKLFDNWSTTDDHLMHITGIAKNATGIKYYLTKNSWGIKSTYDGYLYLSEDFMKLKTIAIMVNKESIPRTIRKKLNME